MGMQYQITHNMLCQLFSCLKRHGERRCMSAVTLLVQHVLTMGCLTYHCVPVFPVQRPIVMLPVTVCLCVSPMGHAASAS